MKRYNAVHVEDYYECLEGQWVRHHDVERFIEDNFKLIECNRKLGEENARLKELNHEMVEVLRAYFRVIEGYGPDIYQVPIVALMKAILTKAEGYEEKQKGWDG